MKQDFNTPIDIIMVAMNNLSDLKRTVQSIRRILSKNIRLVIVDSSTTRELEKYSRNLNRTQVRTIYVWEEAQGIYHAMNTGIKLARRNAVLWFLNPGDILIDASVASNIAYEIQSSDQSWGYALAAYMNSQGSPGTPFPQETTITTAKLFSGHLAISHQSMFIKRAIIMEIGGFDEKFQIASDLDLQFKLLNMTKPVVDHRLMVGIDVTGVSHQKNLKTLYESFRVRLSREEFSIFQSFNWFILNIFLRLYKKAKNILI